MYKAKNHLERILEIDRLVRIGNYPTKSEFCQQFEISAKSIERDFDYLRDRLNAPLEYDRGKKGYYYSDHSYFLPSKMLNERELFSLLMSKQIIESIGDSPVSIMLKENYKKLSIYLPQKIQDDISNLLTRISIIPEPSVKIEKGKWEIILKALSKNISLQFNYKSPVTNETTTRELYPYQIVFFRGGWYLIGLDMKKKMIRNYAINRGSNYKLSVPFTYPKDFNINKYIDEDFGMYVSSHSYSVSIRFSAWCSPYILERNWHKNQKIEYLENGDIILHFQTNQLEAIRQWVLRWGDGCVVLKPQELVNLMKNTIKKMTELYKY